MVSCTWDVSGVDLRGCCQAGGEILNYQYHNRRAVDGSDSHLWISMSVTSETQDSEISQRSIKKKSVPAEEHKRNHRMSEE